MRIAVASSMHGQCGNTTVALFVAHALALTQRQNICLTHADFGNNVLFDAIGMEPMEDVTRSLTHLARMLTNNMLQDHEVPDYAIKVFDGLDLYSTNKIDLDPNELTQFYEFILTKMTFYNHIVMDVDAGRTAEITKLMLNISDVIIVPISHNNTVISKSLEFVENISSDIKRSRRRKTARILFLLNHYDQSIATYKSVATRLGIKPSRLLTLHENKELIKTMNNGKSSDFFMGAIMGSSKMLNIRTDMKVLCKGLLGAEAQWNIGKGK